MIIGVQDCVIDQSIQVRSTRAAMRKFDVKFEGEGRAKRMGTRLVLGTEKPHCDTPERFGNDFGIE